MKNKGTAKSYRVQFTSVN